MYSQPRTQGLFSALRFWGTPEGWRTPCKHIILKRVWSILSTRAYLLKIVIRADELDFPIKFSTSHVYCPLFLDDKWCSVIEFFLNSVFRLVKDWHSREFPPSQIPSSSSSLYHVILGLGLPLVLHFSVMEIPSLATTTDGKLRMVGLFGSMEQKEKLDYSFYLIYKLENKKTILVGQSANSYVLNVLQKRS